MDFTKPEFCPLCGRDETKRHLFGTIETLPKERELSGLETISYDMCRCGLIFHTYMMTDETRRRFYQGEYRASRPEAKDKNVSSSNITEEAFRAKNIVMHLNNRIDKVKRCLDIGCSTGTLLSLLQDIFDCEAIGVELNSAFREYATSSGLNVVEGIKDVEGKFDLITLIHVLEHLTKPLEMLETISGLLNDDGYLIVEVPLPKILGDDDIQYGFNLAHPIAFINITLFAMLAKAGFALVDEIKGRHLMVMAQ
jgi:SAM-dependent methyltransferase